MLNNTLLPMTAQETPSIATARLSVRVARPGDLESIVQYVKENAGVSSALGAGAVGILLYTRLLACTDRPRFR
jgi:hypothetical protein